MQSWLISSLSQKDTTNLLHSPLPYPSKENMHEIGIRFQIHLVNHSPSTLSLRLVGQHSLWAHHLWNAAKVLADYFDSHPELVKGKTVLELGAGGALPSFTTACNGAEKVPKLDTIITIGGDYRLP
jgi:predicted nicotinamide N-methyase